MQEIPSFNSCLIIATYGAVFTAFIYQLILFLHSKNAVLKQYIIYIGWIFIYLTYRLINQAFDQIYSWFYFTETIWISPDEWFQLLGFMLYIRFMGLALDLKRDRAPLSYFFYKLAVPIIVVYLISHSLSLSYGFNNFATLIYLLVRIYLLVFGVLGLIYGLKSKSSTFLNYLSAGAFSIIILGGCSLASVLIYKGGEFPLISAFGFMNLGFLFEIIFFSAAMAVNFQSEIKEKKRALSRVFEQQKEIQAKEIEKIEAVFKSRESERNRIAQDLHDDLGGTLTSIRLYSELIVDVLKTDPAQAEQLLAHVMDNTNEVVENMGDIIWAINLSKAKNITFGERIKDYIFKLNVKNDINFQIQVPEWFDDGLTQPIHRKNFILIVKEAVNNIYKYSKADACVIKIEENGENIDLKIQDNGVGFDPSSIMTGNGLTSMEHRIDAVGGSLKIRSELGKGTQLLFTFPLAILDEEATS